MMYQTTAFQAGAQDICVQSPADLGPRLGEISLQPGFQPVLRRKLMAALSMTGRELGLRPATLMVLDTLMSFLPCKDAAGKEMPVTPLHLLTIYASNETISFRARGLTDRQLRRHFELLERKGLIIRRDSANGKRFPVHQNGKVMGAYGIDISPLFMRSAALVARAAALRDEQQELRGLKAQIMQLRASVIARALPLLPLQHLFLESLRNLTRRVGLTLLEARDLLSRLCALLPSNGDKATAIPDTIRVDEEAHPGQEISLDIKQTPDFAQETAQLQEVLPKETSASAGQNVRHIKPKNTYTKKSNQSLEKPPQFEDDATIWKKLTGISDFFPEPPKNLHALKIILNTLASMLRMENGLIEQAFARLKPMHLAVVLNRILRDPLSIENPNAYLNKVLQRESPH